MIKTKEAGPLGAAGFLTRDFCSALALLVLGQFACRNCEFTFRALTDRIWSNGKLYTYPMEWLCRLNEQLYVKHLE